MYTDTLDIKNRHPCFNDDVSMKKGRLHLPVSPICNIRCKFCKRSFNKTEQRPGVTSKLLEPQSAANLVDKALDLCPDITVVGIAGPGDTLASEHALDTFRKVHERYPQLINCMSTNGLLLERYADDLWSAGVRTVTVTVNAVDPNILKDICSYVFLDGGVYEGITAAEILINAQKRGIEKMSALGAVVKINTVLIPEINDFHIEEIAYTVKSLGASILNIIPLIPQYEMSDIFPPSCAKLNSARASAEKHLPVFRHCQHCRADACGIPGMNDVSSLLYEDKSCEVAQTFSHG
ncbi:MAG: radical SAM protein [Treponema sp.]|jgi:nitrogen fixation protein NifB|nr:radical SAM protein [Treponema sp.]